MKELFSAPQILLIFSVLISNFSSSLLVSEINGAKGAIFGGAHMMADPATSDNLSSTIASKFDSIPVTSGSVSLDRSIRILNQDSITDMVNNLHIRGEFKNISPVTIKQVHVIGTIYDSKTQPLGKYLSLTSPNNIVAGGEGRYELLVMSGSVPLDRIDHYTLQFDFH